MLHPRSFMHFHTLSFIAHDKLPHILSLSYIWRKHFAENIFASPKFEKTIRTLLSIVTISSHDLLTGNVVLCYYYASKRSRMHLHCQTLQSVYICYNTYYSLSPAYLSDKMEWRVISHAHMLGIQGNKPQLELKRYMMWNILRLNRLFQL